MADLNDLLLKLYSGPNPMDGVQAYQQGQENALKLRGAEAEYGDNRLKSLYAQDMMPIQALKLNADVAKEINPINALRVKNYIGDMGTNAMGAAIDQAGRIVADPSKTNLVIPTVTPGKPLSPDEQKQKARDLYEAITGKKAPGGKAPAPPAKGKGKKVSENDVVDPSQDPGIDTSQLLAFNNGAPTMNDAQSPYGPIGSLQLHQPQNLGVDTVQAPAPQEAMNVPQPNLPSNLNIASARDLMQYAQHIPISSLMSGDEEKIITQGMGLQAAQLKSGTSTMAALAKNIQDNVNKGERLQGVLDMKGQIHQAMSEMGVQKADQDSVLKLVADMVREDAINKPHAGRGGAKPVNPLDQEKKIQDTVKDLAKGYESLSFGQKMIPSNQKMLSSAYASITNPDVRSAFYARYKDQIDKFAPTSPTPSAAPAPKPGTQGSPAPYLDILGRQESSLGKLRDKKMSDPSMNIPPGTLSNTLRAMQKNNVPASEIVRIRKQYEGIIP